MRLTLHETTPGEFTETDPDVLRHKAHDALQKAVKRIAPHARGGEIDLPQHVAGHLETLYADRAQRMWGDVADLLLASTIPDPGPSQEQP